MTEEEEKLQESIYVEARSRCIVRHPELFNAIPENAAQKKLPEKERVYRPCVSCYDQVRRDAKQKLLPGRSQETKRVNGVK